MNCDFVKGKIYDWVYTGIKALDDDLIQHVVNCPDCNAWLKDCQSARKITTLLSQQEPVLNNPQKLTNNILDELNELYPEKQSTRFRIFTTAKRILVAASVCLIIVFGYEQYIITDKMIRLEEQMSEVKTSSINSSQLKEILRYYPSNGIEALKSKLTSRVENSRGTDLKSAFMLASLNVLSDDEVNGLLQEYMVQVKFSSEGSGITSTMEKEQQDD